MKVIDLLNKIANGEEVPEHIKYIGIDYSFQYNCREYLSDYGTCFIKNISSNSLNDKVEIIEDTPKEDKKIPEKIKDKYCSQISKVELAQKYNEIIDYLKNKGE